MGGSAVAKAMEDESKASQRGLYTFLRNEPKLFLPIFRCITFIYRNLCRLQQRLQMGSFWKNEPKIGGFLWGRLPHLASFSGNEATGGIATVMSVPRSSPERNSGRAGPEVGTDSTSTTGAGRAASAALRLGSGKPVFRLAFWQNLLQCYWRTGISADPTLSWGRQLRGM